jgi:hypothetical protein
MQDVVKDYRRPAFGTYAEPLSGLRVSWGSVLAGSVTLLAVSAMVLALALGIVSILSHPTLPSLKGSAIALWVCGMAATILGAFAGGWLAGYLPGSTRPGLGVVHGFLSWALALVVSLGFQLFILRATLVAATNTAIEAGVALEAARGAPDDGAPDSAGPAPRTEASRGDSYATGRTALNYVAGFGWSWFGTWFVAGVLAMAGASAGVRRLRRSDFPDEPHYERDERARPMGPPLTPAEGRR